MATRRSKTKYRRRRKSSNRFGMLSIVVVVLLLLVVVSFMRIELHRKNEERLAKEEYLIAQIDKENERKEDLKEQEKYTQTKQYIEDIAKSKLGLVYENEIIFKTEDE